MLKISTLVCLIILLFCSPRLCNASVGELQAKLLAEEITKTKLGFDNSKLLRAHRREDLEDNLFGFQVKTAGKIAKAVYFFEMSETGYFVLSPEEAIYVISNDGELKWLVAISTTTGQPYTLYGFKDAESEFNKLVQDANLSITNRSDAESFAYFYFTLIRDLYGNYRVYDLRSLKYKVESSFLAHHSNIKAKRLYKTWMSGFLHNKLNTNLGVTAIKIFDDYFVSMKYLNKPISKIPQLMLVNLKINHKGICIIKQNETIYPIK